MGRQESYTCDICGRDITDRALRTGLTVTVGYSLGGWGHRRNHVNWSGEVCQNCFDVAGKKTAEQFKASVNALSGMPYEIDLPKAQARSRANCRCLQRWGAWLRKLAGK